MSNFKFTPKKGVLSNVKQFIHATTATAAITAANSLAAAQTLNKIVTDGLDAVNTMEEMAMENVASYFSEQLGEEITVEDIREGNLSEKISEANKEERLLAAQRGQLRIAKKRAKIQKKLEKINKKLALLEQK